jgi:heme exporter protein CcmD
MNNFMHWYSMGGYGIYVWSTYGLVLMGLSLGVLRARRQHNRVRHLLKQWLSRAN